MKESGYKYEFRADGVYLTVYPSARREFELSDMRQELRERKVVEYDVGLLSRTIREASGRAVKIAEAVALAAEEEAADAEPRVVVELTRDRMQASIKYEGKPTKEQVMAALREAGVVYGISEEAIAEGLESGGKFVAAEGLKPVPGENAYIDRKFNLGEQGKPRLDEFGRADYKDLNLFVLAKENQTLAIRIPQTKGTPGKNILGEVVAAQNGRPCPLPEGKNTKVVGERLIATVNGQIVDTGSRISVEPRLELKGGVGVQTGDIDFDGSVQIKGDVEQGFTVKATGDIEIKGSINGAYVSGRNVYITGGVTGADRAKVYAEQDVRTAFAENALIEAAGDIYIADIALHSQIRAGKRLIMEEKHGQITGGHAVAGELVSVKVIGNASSVVTKVSVGVDPTLQKEYVALRQEYKEAKKRLQHIMQTLNTLSKIDINKLPPSRIESINALTRSQFPLAGQIKRDEKRILEIEQQLLNMKKGKIRVSDTIYPGVRLAVNNILKSIQSEYKHCSISLNEAGEVEVGTY